MEEIIPGLKKIHNIVTPLFKENMIIKNNIRYLPINKKYHFLSKFGVIRWFSHEENRVIVPAANQFQDTIQEVLSGESVQRSLEASQLTQESMAQSIAIVHEKLDDLTRRVEALGTPLNLYEDTQVLRNILSEQNSEGEGRILDRISELESQIQRNNQGLIPFSETPFGEELLQITSTCISKIKSNVYRHSIPYITDEELLDLDNFRAFNSNADNSVQINEYLRKVTNLPDDSDERFSRLLSDLSSPITKNIVVDVFRSNTSFQRLVESNLSSFIDENGSIINIQKFINVFMYVNQTFGHLPTPEVANTILSVITFNEVPPAVPTIDSESIVQRIKDEASQKNSTLLDEGNARVDEITNSYSSHNYRILNECYRTFNQYRAPLSLATLVSMAGIYLYNNPQYLIDFYNFTKDYSVMKNIYDLTGLSSSQTVTATPELTSADPSITDTSSNKGKITTAGKGILLIKYLDKFYLFLRGKLVEIFGDYPD